MSEFTVKGGKALRRGYTTGSCATAAAAAAAEMLLSGQGVQRVSITLPDGTWMTFVPEDIELDAESASCAIVKDAGDDPDVTDGMKIFARCHRTAEGIVLAGGEGVGTVTADGLSVPKGEAAINPTPRRMISENLKRICAAHGYTSGLRVEISAPGGDKIALRTFNPRLGIVGGISILGTTGIVEPMSKQALIDTNKLLIDKQKIVDPEAILITPGNFGKHFLNDVLGLDGDRAVKFSNFLGECLDYVAYRQFKKILLVGHLGKMVKVAGGIMDTHSSIADCRMEIFSAHAACVGADSETACTLMACKTVEEALEVLHRTGLAEAVLENILGRILFHLWYRLREHNPQIEVIVFSGDKLLMQSPGAETLVQYFRRKTL